MTEDPDQVPFSPRPPDYFSPFGWDAADQTLFRPLTRLFAVDPAGPATNVTAADELANSSWFQNRIDGVAQDTERFLKAGCGDGAMLSPERGPWRVVSAKLNGANPGFIVKDPDGVRFMMKFDGTEQPERATAADVVGSILYWNAGYYAPCNRIQLFHPSVLKIEPGTMYRTATGDEAALTQDIVDNALRKAVHLADGRIRGSSSRFVDGRPIGPFRYNDTRGDDPNDVVNHEDRRELRGGRVIASWINHFDAREQNSMDAWIAAPTKTDANAGYIRHYYIDFGDCFGSEWADDGITRRLGHSNYLDLGHVAQDFLSLGLIERPWHRPHWGPAGRVFQYFEVANFDPERWTTGYPNPAFERMVEGDGAWMARILSKMSEAQIRATVKLAKFSRPHLTRQLTRVLLGRRRKILQRYFRYLSPLADPIVGNDNELCVTDLAVGADVADAHNTQYRVQAWAGPAGKSGAEATDVDGLTALTPRLEHRKRPGAQRCFPLPTPQELEGNSNGGAYLVYGVTAQRGDRDRQSGALLVHLYTDEKGHYHIAGLERPERSSATYNSSAQQGSR